MNGMVNLLQVGMEMEMDSEGQAEATSPRPFLVIDDNEGEEHGLKLQE